MSITSGEFPGVEVPKNHEWRQGLRVVLNRWTLRPERTTEEWVTGRVVRTFGVDRLIVEVVTAAGASAFLVHSFVCPEPASDVALGATDPNPPGMP